jgi:hypothetical protein
MFINLPDEEKKVFWLRFGNQVTWKQYICITRTCTVMVHIRICLEGNVVILTTDIKVSVRKNLQTISLQHSSLMYGSHSVWTVTPKLQRTAKNLMIHKKILHSFIPDTMSKDFWTSINVSFPETGVSPIPNKQPKEVCDVLMINKYWHMKTSMNLHKKTFMEKNILTWLNWTAQKLSQRNASDSKLYEKKMPLHIIKLHHNEGFLSFWFKYIWRMCFKVVFRTYLYSIQWHHSVQLCCLQIWW